VIGSRSAHRRAAHGAGFVVILAASSAFGPLANDTYLPAFPELSHDLAASASATQATLTAVLIGLALGQLAAGPISDSLGRLRPLLVGVAAFGLTSLLCAVAPTIWSLIGFRMAQGIAGGAGIVIARAIVRDLHEGAEAARYFSLLLLVQAIAPIAAPLLGAQILVVSSWRGIFVALAIFGAVLLAATAWRIPETMPAEGRHRGGLRATLAVFRRLLGRRAFTGYLLANSLPFASMFAYIAGSPFVLQDLYGLSPRTFAIAFGANACGIGLLAHVSGRLVHRAGPDRLLAAGLVLSAAGGVSTLVCTLVHGELALMLASLFVAVSAVGLVLPNATARALAGEARTAGSASALLGLGMYILGAAAAPLVGVAGRSTAVPLGVVMAVLGSLAVVSFALLVVLPGGGGGRRHL
jgi:DHA1 family bicyclomycin/chloramphenicol resistance-like MFS transporter